MLDRYDVDRGRIWFVGCSGGAQVITQYLLPKHSTLVDGGGAVVFGGGGTPRITVQPFAPGLVEGFDMHWYTGGADDGTCDSSYNALRDAQRGSAYYAQRGFTATLETPAGVCHDLSGTLRPGHRSAAGPVRPLS